MNTQNTNHHMKNHVTVCNSPDAPGITNPCSISTNDSHSHLDGGGSGPFLIDRGGVVLLTSPHFPKIFSKRKNRISPPIPLLHRLISIYNLIIL